MIPDYQLTLKALQFIVKRGRNEFDLLIEDLEKNGTDLVSIGWKNNNKPLNLREYFEKE